MANTIVNAAPMLRTFGTQDIRPQALPRIPVSIPQHLPKQYLFAERGTTTEKLLGGAEAQRVYGSKTFDERSKYANHATVFANAFIARANSCVYKRLIPEDAGPRANLTLWLDVLPSTVDTYTRNSDGSIKTDVLGQPILNGTADGFKVKWVVTSAKTQLDYQNFGVRTITVGNQFDPVTGIQSDRFPIAEFAVNSQGAFGNSLGLRIWAADSISNRLPTKMMNTEFAYPFFVSVIEKPDRLATPTVTPTLFGEQFISVVLKPGVIDPSTDRQMYLGDTFVPYYQNKTDQRYPDIDAPIDTMHIYEANIAELIGKFHDAEIPFIDSLSDFEADPEQKYLFNFISGMDSHRRPYHSFVFSEAADSVRLTQYTNIFADGGSDGTLTDDVFARLVVQDVSRYLNEFDIVQDIGSSPESILYDSGFGLEYKLDLVPFISRRRDTFVHLGTHEVGGPTLSASEEHSVAVALRTRIRSFPESEYFGTSTMRGMIMGCSGLIRNSRFTKRLPLTYEVACKSSSYMGSSDGRWKTAKRFQGHPGSILEEMFDINITFVPESVRNRNWDVSLNWVQRSDHQTLYIPAFKTVYDEDTSVLTSYPMAMAICYLNKVAFWVHANFTGRDDLSDIQLCDQSNNLVRKYVEGKFDGRYIIEPVATVTEMDGLRGYSWTLPIRIYGNTMETVMTAYVQSLRMSSMDAVFGTPASTTLGG